MLETRANNIPFMRCNDPDIRTQSEPVGESTCARQQERRRRRLCTHLDIRTTLRSPSKLGVARSQTPETVKNRGRPVQSHTNSVAFSTFSRASSHLPLNLDCEQSGTFSDGCCRRSRERASQTIILSLSFSQHTCVTPHTLPSGRHFRTHGPPEKSTLKKHWVGSRTKYKLRGPTAPGAVVY